MSDKTEMAIVPPKETALQVFKKPNGLDPYLDQIRDKIDAFKPDVSTRKGREAIASIAYSVARSKKALDDVGKELVAELKEIPKLIDAERKRMRDTLESWQLEVRQPLTDWERAEQARKDRHVDNIQAIKDMEVFGAAPTAAAVTKIIADLEAIELGESWEEFMPEAAQTKDRTLSLLRAMLAERTRYEAEQAELTRLRAESEAQAQRDRDAAIARQAAEQARIEAAERAEAERLAAARREQDLKDQAEAQQRAAEQKLRDAEAEAERQRLQIKLQEEQAELQKLQAEQDRIEGIQRAENERLAAERRQAEAVERARLAEVQRQEDAKAEELRQQKAREDDKAHKASINRAALEAFIAGGMPEDCARQAVTLIAQRKIPAITIAY
ncbi:hypothetical protein [Pseudomonas syringae]|uniref:hypothetical protein n=1 Tax=Pseudomonas syringae TaxID=317 RepID=UPI000E317EFA|nr:hypothetical protein [Pseudomonas syringae]